ncbi:enoyl-CoA hydratase/isomerase family protein [Dietzia lutea]|uniref:Enoyl-CoA hydratase n=1 Tax=Dietzia lutea TaxID=546160 RepID=A0A2S1RD03_9ACTN|nr:enoyl-CoA hydratase/isomerase family protein [Dietzia lutea]AWH94111.1 hypothetical protein A6035_17300 [Dietzia lutea]
MTASTIEYREAGSVATIRLQRPEVHNALDAQTLGALVEVAEDAAQNPAVAAIVLTGGPRAFTSGIDLKELARLDAAGLRSQAEALQKLATVLRYAPKPTIAAVSGLAYGGGLETAVNCDARIATPAARFACPEVRVGLTITNGSSMLLRRLIGDGWTRELTLFGAVLDAETAQRIGLVTRVVEPDDLEAEAQKMAQYAASCSQDAVRRTKELLNADPRGWRDMLTAETEAVVAGFGSAELQTSLRAFAERRTEGGA